MSYIDVLIKADTEFWKKYKGESNLSPEDAKALDEQLHRIPDMILESDLDSIFTDAEDIDAVSEDFVNTYIRPETDNEAKKIMRTAVTKAYKSATIRRDFATALKGVKKGYELSGPLDYGFTKKDLKALGDLHKRNRFRAKIEDLLEDCNFHTECSLLNSRQYDRFEELLKEKGAA